MCCPDEHEVLGTNKSLRHGSPDWYNKLLAISDDRLPFPPGELYKVADDAPKDVHLWPIMVFRIPRKHRFGKRRNARVGGVDVSGLRALFVNLQADDQHHADAESHQAGGSGSPTHQEGAHGLPRSPTAPAGRLLQRSPTMANLQKSPTMGNLPRSPRPPSHVDPSSSEYEAEQRKRLEASFDRESALRMLNAADWTGASGRAGILDGSSASQHATPHHQGH